VPNYQQSMKAYGGVGVEIHEFLTSALEEATDWLHASAPLQLEKSPIL
jgi:hypothetical protein